jgi:hypothetical protein
MMFFQKNLPLWERALRVCLGLLLAGAGFYFAGEPLIKWIAVGAGVTLVGTGFFGFCPMCAMAGRTLSK